MWPRRAVAWKPLSTSSLCPLVTRARACVEQGSAGGSPLSLPGEGKVPAP